MAAETVSTSTRVHRRAGTRDRARLPWLTALSRLVARASARTWAVFAEATALLVDVGPHGAGDPGTAHRSGAAHRSDATHRPAATRKAADR